MEKLHTKSLSSSEPSVNSDIKRRDHLATLLRRYPALRRLLKDKGALTGLVVVLLFVIIGILAPYLAPFDVAGINLAQALQGPSLEHPMGTDQLGRDIFSRVLFGTRISLQIGVVTVSVALALGVPLGVVGGYIGGWPDTAIVLIIDILLAFPTILLALIMISILGPDLRNAIIAVGVASMPIFARLARASTISVKQNEYILAAIALGESKPSILVRHIFPNITSPLIVQTTLRIGTAILTAASLSFLGLGAQPPTPEWGAMVSEGRTLLQVAPHIIIFPGLAIMLCILGFSVLGDGLNDALNPQISSGD